MKPIHLVIPMSGQGHRYRKAGYTEPKPLVPVNGLPMVERVINLYPPAWPAHFILAENHRSTPLPALLARLRPHARVTTVPVHAKGPGHAVEAALDGIPDDAPVLVSYCDFGMRWDAAAFERFVRETACDACLISYRGFHPHYLRPTMYAYSRMDGDRVVEVKEKGCFTDDRQKEFASAGAYYFRTAKILREALHAQRNWDLQLNGEFYVSLTVQALLKSNPAAHVRVFEVPAFFQWGTPEDLQDFEYWERTLRARNSPSTEPVAQVLMPMAGRGSRLAELSGVPKPLVPVRGEPMFRRALASLPAAERVALVALEAIRAQLSPHAPAPRFRVVYLPAVPDGQALSTRAGLTELDLSAEVLVSACDHAVILGDSWRMFHRTPDCDAAIFTIRGFPGASRRPNHFAYVQVADDSRFPLVTGVSVKKPLSERPQQDPLLVGTFWFRTGHLLKEGIDAIVKEDARVNGELYLDSVFDRLRRAGRRVRAIPLDGYINWGDPESLAEALYWEDHLGGAA